MLPVPSRLLYFSFQLPFSEGYDSLIYMLPGDFRVREKIGSSPELISSTSTSPFVTTTSPFRVTVLVLLLTFIIEMPCDLVPKRVSNPNLMFGSLRQELVIRKMATAIRKIVLFMTIELIKVYKLILSPKVRLSHLLLKSNKVDVPFWKVKAQNRTVKVIRQVFAMLKRLFSHSEG